MTVRVRFAPSPTGYLHIGGARTALFNYLHARRHQGTFVLRIEDTDRERSTEASLQAILDGLRWLGIDWDEGPGKGGAFGPYTQMEKLPRYRALAEGLIAEGKAYRDFATEDEVDAARRTFAAARGIPADAPLAELRKAGFKWRSPWRDRSPADAGKSEGAVVRFKLPERQGQLAFDDLVLGHIEKPLDDLDDFVLLRSDGVPVYNFGCVVDDHDMEISLVGRGQEHVNSTFPQLLLYEAFGWASPRFAHFPLILGPDREKLSKRRHPEADVMLHKQVGVLPEALVNFIARLGWSHGNDEILDRSELVSYFGFDHVGKTSGVWNPAKLTWLNEQWLKRLPPAELAARLVPFLAAAGVEVSPDDPRIVKVIEGFRARAKSLVEMAQAAKPYFSRGVSIDAAAAAKHLGAEGRAVLARAQGYLEAIEAWDAASIEAVVDRVAQDASVKKGAVAQPLRVATTGGTVSPGIGETLVILGRDEALARIASALC